MARKRKNRQTRGNNYTSNPQKLRFGKQKILNEPVKTLRRDLQKNLRSMEDRRTFHPDRNRPFRSFFRVMHRLGSFSPKTRRSRIYRRQIRERIGFVDPRFVLVCVRRKIRREVLMALGEGRGGRGSQKKAHWSEASRLKC